MGYRCHEANRRKSKCSGEKSVPATFNHRSHMEWPGAEPGLPRWKAGSTIVNGEFQGVWKETALAYLRYYPRLCNERLWKIKKNISQSNPYSKYGITKSEVKYLTMLDDENCVRYYLHKHNIKKVNFRCLYNWDGRPPGRPLNTNVQWRLRGNQSILLMVSWIWKVTRHIHFCTFMTF